jgi:nucleotide-binding universal stress UspA family protein
MMISLGSILVDEDAVATHHPALERALGLARRSGARVKIVDVLPWVPSGVRHFVTPVLEKELIEHRRERLAAIAKDVPDIPVTTELLRGRPATAVSQEVLRANHSLLVRSHGRDLAESPRPFGAIDMELLRQCPCPVWLIGPRSRATDQWRILAAIRATAAELEEQELNAQILEWGLLLKSLGAAELTVLQAWTPYGASLLRSRLSPEEFSEFIETSRRTEDEALSGCLAPYRDRLTGVSAELVHGEPEDAITRYVESHGVDVVVMGTVARTGIAGLVMGNTAERVLQRLRGSVFAVKPPGFQTPTMKMRHT